MRYRAKRSLHEVCTSARKVNYFLRFVPLLYQCQYQRKYQIKLNC